METTKSQALTRTVATTVDSAVAPRGVAFAAAEERPLGLTFTGSASEFFRVWIVNVFLTVITLGIYAAWAKVRTRRYFYTNTHLAGHTFDYLASPVALLKGNLIFAVGLAIFYFTGYFMDYLENAPDVIFYSGIIVLYACMFSVPLLIYKSLRFRVNNTTYRYIRFRFRGTAGESYGIHFFLYLLVPLTIGLAYPFVAFHQKAYFFGNLAFGRVKSHFFGKARRFYPIYITASLIGTVLFGVLFFLLTRVTALGDFALGRLSITALFLLSVSVARQFIYAKVTNYCFENTVFGLGADQVSFKSNLRAGDLITIHLSNLAAIILSVGLLIPWARVRRTRYVLSKIGVVAEDLDHFEAEDAADDGALGEAAADFFDFELGL